MKIETKKGFTFLEIMIMVVIIALLVALAIPAFQKFRQTSQKKTMINNLRQLASGADQYFLEEGLKAVTFSELIGNNNYAKAIDKVADETYTSPLTTATTQLTAIASAVSASITF